MTTKVNVFGLGRVGLITTIALASNGHNVNAVDINESLVENLKKGCDPFGEPEFVDLLRQYKERISFSASLDKEARDHFVCVPSPFSSETKGYDLGAVESVVQQIKSLGERVVVRSTVGLGTCRRISEESGLSVVYMPEFHREGSFVKDWRDGSMTIFAGPDVSVVKKLFSQTSSSVEECSWEEAEALKMSANLFHGLKVSFANEVGRLAASYGARPERVMELFCQDTHLNISKKYLRPGFAYGGPCLTKDIASFISHDQNSVALELSKGVHKSNQSHIRWVTEKILAQGFKRVFILGEQFKAGNSNSKESPVIELAQRLQENNLYVLAAEPGFQSCADEIVSITEGLIQSEALICGGFPWTEAIVSEVSDFEGPLIDLHMQPIPPALLENNKVLSIFGGEI